MRPILAALLIAVPVAASALAQDEDLSKVEIKLEKVAGAVYMLTGSGGNIGVSIGPDGVLIVDDQFAPLAPKINQAIRGITDKQVRFVLNTHWHFDHTEGNVAFAPSAVIIAHDNVRRRLRDSDPAEVAGHKTKPTPAQALPVITFDKSLTVHINGESISALHYARGHTDGDSIVYFSGSNVVHMGDDFVTYGFPFVDVASGGSVVGMVENVEKAMASLPADVRVIPGHGPISSPADVKHYTEMLRDCIGLVRAAIGQGLSIAEMKRRSVLARHDALGHDFIKTDAFIELIASELEGTPRPSAQNRHH